MGHHEDDILEDLPELEILPEDRVEVEVEDLFQPLLEATAVEDAMVERVVVEVVAEMAVEVEVAVEGVE